MHVCAWFSTLGLKGVCQNSWVAGRTLNTRMRVCVCERRQLGLKTQPCVSTTTTQAMHTQQQQSHSATANQREQPAAAGAASTTTAATCSTHVSKQQARDCWAAAGSNTGFSCGHMPNHESASSCVPAAAQRGNTSSPARKPASSPDGCVDITKAWLRAKGARTNLQGLAAPATCKQVSSERSKKARKRPCKSNRCRPPLQQTQSQNGSSAVQRSPLQQLLQSKHNASYCCVQRVAVWR